MADHWLLILDRSLLKVGSEAPWHRDDIFNFDQINSDHKPDGPEDYGQKYLREVLSAFNKPNNLLLQRGVKYILASIALVGREADPPPPPADFTDAPKLAPAVKEALNSAHFYKSMQTNITQKSKALVAVDAGAIDQLTLLCNDIYSVCQGISSIRSRLLQFQSNPNTAALANDLDYDAFANLIKCDINPANMAPLVALLTGGVKCLMTYPRSGTPIKKFKLIHFLIMMDQLHQNKPIEEPIWKRTQAYILECIMGGLFPKGIDKSVLTDGLSNDHSWAPVDCKRWNLAHAIHLDFREYCISRAESPDLSISVAASLELPRCDDIEMPSSVSAKQKSKMKKNPL